MKNKSTILISICIVFFTVITTVIFSHYSEAQNKHGIGKMKISDIINKVVEENVSLFEMNDYSIVIKDLNGKEMKIDNLKVKSDRKTIFISVNYIANK